VINSQDRTTWLAARMESVGGSEIAAVLGESKYETREQLAMTKAGLAEPFSGNEATELGNEMEPTIAAIAAKRWGWQLTRDGFYRQDTVCPRLSATPDYTMPTPYGMACVQIKFTSCQPPEMCKPRKDGSPSTAAFAGGPPIAMQLQMQSEMCVTGYEHGALLVLHLVPMTLRPYFIPRHDAVIRRMRREVALFWDEVEALRAGKVAV